MWDIADPFLYKENIRRDKCQYYWLHCTDQFFPQILLTSNGWNCNEQLNVVVSVWFDGPQFPPRLSGKK